MKPVTDPTLIAQLEGNATQPTRKLVTDPGTLAALEGAEAPIPLRSVANPGAAEYFSMVDEATRIARPNSNVFPPILAELTDQGAAVTAGANRRAEGQRLAAESIARGEAGFRGVTSDDLPTRTLGEFGGDMLSLFRSGAKEGLALIPELPVRLANMLSASAGQFTTLPTEMPMLEQPDIVRQLAAAARGDAAADAADVSQVQSLYGSEQAAISQADLGFWEGLAEQIKYGVVRPGAVAGELSRVGGQMAGGGVLPGASVPVNLLAQGLQAGGLNASQVRAELEAAGIPEDQIAQAEATVFGLSSAINTLLPKAVPGGTAVERVLAGKAGQGARGAAARLAIPTVGETVTEGGAEGIDQIISNVETGKDPLQGAGAATGMGALIGAPMGATAGGIDALAAIANQAKDEDAAGSMVELLSKLGLQTDPVSLIRPPEPAQEPASAPEATTVPAPAPNVAPAAAPAAPAVRPAAEVGTVIDTRIAELEAAAKDGRLEPEALAATVAESRDLADLLKAQRKARADGVILSPENRLTETELDEADARLTALTQVLEKNKAARSAEKQLTRLRNRLDRIDADADLAALAEEIAPFKPAAVAAKPEMQNVQEQSQEGLGQEGREEGQVRSESAGRVPGEAQAQQQGQGAVNDQAEGQEGPGQKALEEGQAGRESSRPVAGGVQGPQPGRPTDGADPLSPRAPAPVAAPEGATREQLVERARNAPTPAARAEAAAQLAAFDKANPEAPKLRSAATIKDRVQRSIGRAFRGVNVHKGHQDAPEHLRKLLEQEGNDDVEGLYDPSTGEVHIFEDKLDTKRMSPEDRAVWVAAHERLGHAGIRGAFNGSVDSVLKRARQNPSVARIIKAMEGDRPEQGEIVVEEALAELAAALFTNNFSEIKNRYGVTFSPAEKTTLRRYIDNLIRAIRKAIGLSESVSDADIIALLADARRYAEENDAAPTGRASRRPVAQRVFQGSPTRGIERMSLNKVGSGEGNAAFGWGLYFASKQEVAEFYRRGLSAVGKRRGGRLADKLMQQNGNRKDAIERLRRGTTSDGSFKFPGESYVYNPEQVKDAEAFIRADNNRGQLYQVEVPEDSDLLDWDVPLSEQPEKVKELLREKTVLGDVSENVWKKMTGAQLYANVENGGVGFGEPKTQKEASMFFGEIGIPGLRYRDGASRNSDTASHNYVIWNEGAIGKPEPLIASRAARLLKNLTPAEQKKVTDKVAAKIITQLEALPSKKEMAAVAVAGSAKRGWYKESAETISAVFGPDAPLFAGLLAALSPQIGVEGNLKNALNVWGDWVDAGRPTDADEILSVMRSSLRRTFGGSLPAWENNTVRALQGAGILSGPKVDSFMRNLLGNVEEVTNDAWMANFALVNQSIFSGQLRLTDSGDKVKQKGPGYLAMSVRVRETARELTRLTGETWTPAEVQETIWSWAKTLTEMTDSAAEVRTAQEIVLDDAVTDELIASTPDFGTLFTQGEYRALLEDSGYGDQLKQVDAKRAAAAQSQQGPGARRKASPFAGQDQKRLEVQAAKRVDERRKQRLESDNAPTTEPEEDIPFSRRQTKNVYGPDQGRDLAGLPVRVRVGETVYEFHGYEPAQEIAAKYAKRNGNTLPTTYAQVDEARAKRIAAAYDRAQHQPQDPETKRAYAAMIEETLAQYRDILKTGLKVEFIAGEDPYAASPRMAILDVVENNHLWVFPTTDGFGSSELDVSDNPLLAETEFEISGRTALANDIFRVVHDYFGHIANGVGFRADGEENAWREHVAMYSPLAARAMTSETRGQNSWVNYGPNGEANRTASSADTVFADQKTTLLPKWVSEDGAGDVPVASRVAPRTRALLQDIDVQNPAFQRWIGESEATGIVYHGSATGAVDVFDGDAGFAGWFSEEPEQAAVYAARDNRYGAETEATIYPAYISVQNPLHLQFDMNGSAAPALAIAKTLGPVPDRWQPGAPSVAWNIINSDEFAQLLRDNGYDGVRVNEKGVPTWAVLDATQVKSAIGNSGEFNPEDPSIIASRGWSAKKPQPDAVEVVGVHYSNKPGLKQLDPRKAGSAGAGRERRRFGMGVFGENGGIAARLGFYVQDGDELPIAEDVVRQAGGVHPYTVRLTNLYDLDADPRGLVTMNVDATEEAISDEGFDGFVTADVPGIDSRVAVVFDIGKKKIPVEAVDEGPVASRRTPQQARAQRATTLGQLAANGFPMGSPTQQPGGRFLPLKAAADEMRRKLQDKMLPVLRAQDRTGAPNAPGVTSVTMDDAMNAYRMENLMYGRTRDRIEKADQDYVLRVQRMMKNTGVSVEQLEDYLLARHAPERNARIASINPAKPDSGSGISTQQARDILAGTAPGVYSGKPLSADVRRAAGHIAAVLDQMRDETLANLVSSGQIDLALANTLKQRYPNYVPLRGIEGEQDSASGRGTGRGLSVVSSGIKRALGRSQDSLAQNILGEMVGDLQRSIVTDEKSKVGQAFLKFAMANPAPDLYTIEPVDLEWKFSEATGEAYLGIRSTQEDADTTLIVRHNGQPVRIRFESEELAKAMVNLDAPDLGNVLKAMAAINRWRSAVLTRYNPGFAPVNLTRDAIFGATAITSEKGAAIGAKTVAGYPFALKAMWSDARSKPGDSSVPDPNKSWDDWAREFAEQGGKTGMTQVDDVLDLQRKLVNGSNTLMQLAAQGKAWPLARESVKRSLMPLVNVIEDFNDATENAIRLSVYKALREDGESAPQAAEYAKNVTINFNRKGEMGSTLNAIYLFYNAAMQGTHAVFRVMKNPKVSGLLVGLASLQYILATAMMDDDDEDGITAWDKVPDYVKRTSLVIPLGWKTGNPDDYFSLPMPYGFNLFPYAGGRTAQWMRHGERPTDSSITSDIAASTVEAFSPVPLTEGSRSIFGDTLGFLIGLYSNTDDFGNPIVADRFAPEGTPKALLGKSDTPQAYHLASRAMAHLGGGDLDKRIAPVGPLDIAPEQIEALVGFATGGVGSIINRTGRLSEQAAAKNLEGAMEFVSATPIASRFIARANADRAIADRYYGEAGELRRNLDVLKERVRAGGPETFDATMEELTGDDPMMRGVIMDRYKRDGKWGNAGQPKLTETGAPVLKAEPDSAFRKFKDAERFIEDINRNVRTIRAAKMTNGELIVMMAAYGPVSTDGGADEVAGAAARNRAIKVLQRERARMQQRFLQATESQRNE